MLQTLWNEFTYQPHQVEGVEWMLGKEKQTPSGGILCDEMGLGKTIQILGLIKESPKEMTLLIGPLSVLRTWEQTAKRAGFQVWVSHPTKSDWLIPDNYDPSQPQLYVVNYERAIARKSMVADTEWSRVVFDEAHKIGNSETKSYQMARSIQAEHKWFLTATPITNRIQNALALFQVLGYKHLRTSMDSLKPLIASSVLCRKMADLRATIPSLPQCAESVKHILDFDSEEEAEFYRGIQGIIQKRWTMLEQESGSQGELLRLIMRLRQISIHPQVYISARKKTWKTYTRDDFLDPSTKFNKLQSLIEGECKENHRWLVFCHFHEEMELLQNHLLDSPVVRECGLYSGKLSAQEREEAIEVSKEPLYGLQQEVLLVQLMSGGVGLNLQHFDRVVFMGPWWTAALMDQAVGRAVRIGQTNKVMVHHLVLKEEESTNIDKMMLEKAELKRGLCEEFLGYAKGQEKQSLS
jgi:SNF2 family DNA or RNA helicase